MFNQLRTLHLHAAMDGSKVADLVAGSPGMVDMKNVASILVIYLFCGGYIFVVVILYINIYIYIYTLTQQGLAHNF